jgi:hypothetical protein
MQNIIVLFAQVYDGGTYDSSTYGNGTVTGNSGVLTNTGFDLLVLATIAVTLIFIAMLVRFWKRPSKNKLSTDS